MRTPPLGRRSILVLLVAVLAVLLWYASAAFRVNAGYSLAHIERADTPAARERGLGGRADIPADYGMLFVFPRDGDYAFWMKDMLVPIDIIWISDEGVVLGVAGSVATSTYPKEFHPPMPVRYVLETSAGNAAAHGWRAGTVLNLPLPR